VERCASTECLVLFMGVARCTIGDGSTVSFWGDLWSSEILAFKFPVLFFLCQKQRHLSQAAPAGHRLRLYFSAASLLTRL